MDGIYYNPHEDGKHMRPDECLHFVKECAKRWNRPAGIIVEFSIDFRDDGVVVKARDGAIVSEILIPFIEIEKVGKPAVYRYLGSINTDFYCRNDVAATDAAFRVMANHIKFGEADLSLRRKVPNIKRVISNDPATIVMWSDNTKTVVKAENEAFDPEKGLAMAIAKKALGNMGNYYNEFRKYLGDDHNERRKNEG